MNNHLQTFDQIKTTLIDLGLRYGPRVVVASIILVLGIFAARSVGRFFERSLSKIQMEPPIRSLLLRLIRLVVVLLFVLMALTNLEINLLPLIAGMSVVGAGIALAMQGVLGNLAAGLTILFTKPFRVGEYVELLGVEGQVTNIELFSTTLLHPDLSRVVIPNRKIVGELLHNHGTIRQLDLRVGVAYRTDVDRALAIVRQILQANPRVLKSPVPAVGIAELADSSVTLSVRPWTSVADFVAVRPEILHAVLEQFRAARIEIPFPQREVRLLGAPE